jgi:hypothetical protein
MLHYLRDRKLGMGETSLTISTIAQYRPVAGVEVSILGPSGEQRAITNQNGGAVFRNLQSGRYTFTARQENYSLAERSVFPRDVEIVDRTCPSGTIEMQARASVEGVVADAHGKPLPFVSLDLSWVARSEAEEGQLTPSFDTVSDDAGHFRFDGVNPGEYYLGTSLLVHDSPFGQVYYPGRRTKQEAATITVALGANVDGLQLTMPDFGKRKEFRILVVDQSGRPVIGAEIRTNDFDWDEDDPNLGALASDLKTGADGWAVAKAYSKMWYQFCASDGHFRTMRTSETVTIGPSERNEQVVLLLKPLWGREK